MFTLPLGNLARSRRDWTIQQLRYGYQNTNGANDNQSDIYSLNNNAKDGTYLAVWAIFAFWQTQLPIMRAVMIFGLDNVPGTNNDFQLMPGTPLIPGFTTFSHNSAPVAPGIGMGLMANGENWFERADAPLFILPPGYKLVLFTQVFLGLIPLNTPSFVNFVWGPYTVGKTPRRTT